MAGVGGGEGGRFLGVIQASSPSRRLGSNPPCNPRGEGRKKRVSLECVKLTKEKTVEQPWGDQQHQLRHNLREKHWQRYKSCTTHCDCLYQTKYFDNIQIYCGINLLINEINTPDTLLLLRSLQVEEHVELIITRECSQASRRNKTRRRMTGSGDDNTTAAIIINCLSFRGGYELRWESSRSSWRSDLRIRNISCEPRRRQEEESMSRRGHSVQLGERIPSHELVTMNPKLDAEEAHKVELLLDGNILRFPLLQLDRGQIC